MDNALDPSSSAHRFSWDGFSLLVPGDWNLSQYDFARKVPSLQLQDDIAIRLEMEWIRPPRPLQPREVARRFEAWGQTVTRYAEVAEPVAGLPAGWTSVFYSMPDQRHLVTAFWLAPDGRFFCFLKLHFERTGRAKPVRVLRLVASSFVLHRDGPIPWECYDVSFTLSRDFRLVMTSFQAGSKLMAFEWALRRLYVWQVSLADIILKKRTLAQWGAEALNGFKAIHGVRFAPDGDARISVKRRFLLGHYDEIGRWCFRYAAVVRHDPGRNLILLVAYHYRKPADLRKLAESVAGPSLAPLASELGG